MPDVRKCAIFGCASNSRDNPNLKFFNFPPRDSPVYPTWFKLCAESAAALTIIRRPYICSNHFHPWQVGFRRLAHGALPQLKLKAPPGFAEKEKKRQAAEAAAKEEKDRLYKLTNDVVLEHLKRIQAYDAEGSALCLTRRQLQDTGKTVRDLLGATLLFNVDEYWLRKFRKAHLVDFKKSRTTYNDSDVKPSLDLSEIILSIDPNARILNQDEIDKLLEKEHEVKFKNVYPKNSTSVSPEVKSQESETSFKSRKRSFKEAIQDYYANNDSNSSSSCSKNESTITIKSEKIDDVQQDESTIKIKSKKSM